MGGDVSVRRRRLGSEFSDRPAPRHAGDSTPTPLAACTRSCGHAWLLVRTAANGARARSGRAHSVGLRGDDQVDVRDRAPRARPRALAPNASLIAETRSRRARLRAPAGRTAGGPITLRCGRLELGTVARHCREVAPAGADLALTPADLYALVSPRESATRSRRRSRAARYARACWSSKTTREPDHRARRWSGALGNGAGDRRSGEGPW